MSDKAGSRWWVVAAAGAAFLGIMAAERWRPLRRRVEPQRPRLLRNGAVAALTAAVTWACEQPVVPPILGWVERRRFGLLHWLGLPLRARRAAGFLLLDYSLYGWHMLAHRSKLLWRAHVVHHQDLDLDASTGIRFHFWELAWSTLHRASQILLLGVDRVTLAAWQNCLLVSILFHHSNLGLPVRVEAWLNRLVVTPRMHGIHHSIVEREASHNFSSLLTVWDWLHGTLLLSVPQQQVTVGIPAYPEPLPLREALELPFVRQRYAWERPNGTRPEPFPCATGGWELAE